MLSWLRNRRRRSIREQPFPVAWDGLMRRNVRHAEWLDEHQRQQLREWIAVFLAEKSFEGCGGMQITDEVRVTIAGQAGIIALGFSEEYFDRLRSVLVYPGDYLVPRRAPLDGGGELEWQEVRLGETWSGGSVVLSWPRVVDGGRLRDGGTRSVVIHEFSHLIDMLDGEIDGVPPLDGDRGGWMAEMQDCRERFERALDAGRFVALDDYAAEGPGEFFAVATECFFQDPHRLARGDGQLYDLLRIAWRQDPKARVPVRPQG
jgi:Mlc titration factor MtfA (ptsG expression regulator)